MADVGAAAIFDARPGAPIAHDRFLVAAEIGIVFGHVAGPPEPQSGRPAHRRAAGDMEHRPVDPVMLLADLLDQQFAAGEVGLDRGAEQARQHGQVERHRRPAAAPGSSDAGSRRTIQSKRAWTAASPPSRSTSCGIGPCATSSPARWNAGEQEAGIAIAEIELASRGSGHVGRRRLGDAVRPIAAAREPHGVDAVVGHHFAQRRQPHRVAPGEMPVAFKTLRVDAQIAVAARGGDRLNLRRCLAAQRAARRDHRDFHAHPVCHVRASGNRAPPMSNSTFFCGIGGSGMLPLACIVRANGGRVAGSDRALDAGRLAPKFDFLRSLGIALFPQDGSGLAEGMTLVTSGAVEDTVPDVVRARELGLPHLTRPQLLAQLLNAAQRSVAVGGTSGKSTVTGMIGWILHALHRQPTVMNGAVMKNFVSPAAPFASALVGDPELFVSEVDESDGSIALYHPEVAVLTNISLDHLAMDELRGLFAGFLGAARKAVLNLDDPETRALADLRARRKNASDMDSIAPARTWSAATSSCCPTASRFTVDADGEQHAVKLTMPGRHNASNALAALAATRALGVPLADGVGRAWRASQA